MEGFDQLLCPVLTGGLASLVLSLLLAVSTSWHGRFSLDTYDGIQKIHTDPTPRIGGVSIFVGVFIAWQLSSNELKQLLTPWLLASVPALGLGLVEDITKRVSISLRLSSTIFSGLLGCWLSGYAITRVDILVFDQLLQWVPFAVVFTAFAVSGVINSINIIDGLNGLACSMVFYAMLGLAGVAYRVNDPLLAQACVIFATCVVGFFIINWPFGKLFLGDGGSYFIGFFLAWGCVILIERHADVTAFTAVLLCIHPITEVLFSMWRRWRRQYNLGHSDRLHLHSLVERRIMPRLMPKCTKRIRNSMAGLIIGGVSVIPAILAQYVYASPGAAQICIAVFLVIYIYLYKRVVSFQS